MKNRFIWEVNDVKLKKKRKTKNRAFCLWLKK